MAQSVPSVYRRDSVTITAFAVLHDPIDSPFGYRIDYRGRSIAISGDTSYAPSLVTASEGVDILFHEALDPDMVGSMQQMAESRGADVVGKILSDIPSYHTPPEDAARAAQEAGAGTLIFYTHHPTAAVAPASRLFPRRCRGAIRRTDTDGR